MLGEAIAIVFYQANNPLHLAFETIIVTALRPGLKASRATCGPWATVCPPLLYTN